MADASEKAKPPPAKKTEEEDKVAWRKRQCEEAAKQRAKGAKGAKVEEGEEGEGEEGKKKDGARAKFLKAFFAEFDKQLGEARPNIVIDLHHLPGVRSKFWLEEDTLKKMKHVKGADGYEFASLVTKDKGVVQLHFTLRE